MKFFKELIFVILLAVFMVSCGSDKKSVKYRKSPIDKLITQYIDTPNFSVILADMDYKEAEDSYYHKYKIIVEKSKVQLDSSQLADEQKKADDIIIEDTGWQKVDDIFFEDHIKNLGMTILSKKDGVLDKMASPAGYDNYVGNERYGKWQNNSSNGSSFWVFYGRYRFMSDLFYGSSHRYYRNSYNDYHGSYRGRQSYYGTGNNTFGTNSRKATTASNWNSKPSSFKNKVRNTVTRSASASRSRGYNSGSSYSKTQRNSSRYSNSSSRSRSGGYGK